MSIKTVKRRFVLKEPDDIGKELAKVDRHLIAILHKRTKLAEQIEEWKTLNGNQPLIRPEVEEERLFEIKKWAKNKGINPFFAQTLLYLVMAEACRVETISRQARISTDKRIFEANKESWYRSLRGNLIKLTREYAPVYDEHYGDEAPFSTASYVDFENEAIKRIAGNLKAAGNMDMAIDLGCATGRVSFLLAPYHFKKVIGYDISPDMISWAQEKNRIHLYSMVTFQEKDISEGIPLPNNSVSFVVMNLGTASDIPNLKAVIADIKRVLKQNGRFLLSFYNSAAITHHWSLPWVPSLSAGMNPVKHCLDVAINNRILQVYARSYSVSEVKKLLAQRQLKIDTAENGHPSIKTYPTIASILPDEFFEGEDEVKTTIRGFDEMLSAQTKGAYILVTGRKA